MDEKYETPMSDAWDELKSWEQLGCTCSSCLKIKQDDYKRAYMEWIKGNRKISYQSYYYECSDGCCSNWGTKMYINDLEVGEVESYQGRDIELLMEFLGIENVLIDFDESEEI